MDLRKAAISYFDGDPFLINYWLLLYEKYWRGQVNKLYVSVAYDPKILPDHVVSYIKKMFAKYPEIEVYYFDCPRVPESTNPFLIEKSTEPYLLLLESDGFIFDPNAVNMFFSMLETDQADIICAKHPLVTYKYYAEQGFTGIMRNFCFIKRELLNKIELDYYPKLIPAGTILPNTTHLTTEDINLDCFGWVSLQLFNLNPRITYIEGNCLHPDTWLKPSTFDSKRWLHVRQMSSSALGMGKDGEFGMWADKDQEKYLDQVFKQFGADFANGASEFIYLKACALKLLFYDALPDKELIADFADMYYFVFNSVIDWLALSREKIAEAKGFYKGLIGV